MLHRLTLGEMAAAIARREITSRELVDAHLAQIERVNPRLNAFIGIHADEARREALHPRPGPLSGIPVTVKDSFDMAGKPTTGGSTLRRDAIAAEDAVSVARLRAAGAIVLGKTNLPEFLMNYESDNHLIGRTDNPWSEDRTAGGSSGGEAAAIASFCSAGGIGSDAGGSIRVPAAFCGIAGLKPTPGRCPGYGHWPSIGHPGGLLGVGGPMARTLGDLRRLFSVLSGHDPRDPFSVPGPYPGPEPTTRAGVMDNFCGVPVEPAMAAAVARARQLLEQIGVACEPWDAQPLKRAPNVWGFFFGELSAQFIFLSIAGVEDKVHPLATELIEKFRDRTPPSSAEMCARLAERDQLRATALRMMEETPVVLSPCGSVTAWRHGQRRFELPGKTIGSFEALTSVTVWNTLGFPVVTLPMGLSEEGLPAGVQLAGRPWEEERLLALAERLEEARGPFPSPPGL